MKKGVLFMANNKSLISFSLISSMWGQYKKDSIDMLVPFVLYSFSDLYNDNKIVSVIDTKRQIEKEFGLKILSNVLEIIFNRLSNSPYNVLQKSNKDYVLIKDSINISEFKNQRENNKIANYTVQKEFYQFLNDKGIEYERTVADEALIAYLCNYGKDVISDNIVFPQVGDIWNYRVGEFVQHILQKNEDVFDYIKNIAKGGMIANIVFSNNISEYKISKKFKNTTIYFDTPLLMHILGYSGLALKESVTEMVELLTKQGARLCYFRHNLEELEGILNAYIRLYDNNKLDQSYNFDYFIENKITSDQVIEYRILLEQNLKKEGLTLEETPSYENVKGNIDWIAFDEYLSNNIRYTNANRRKNDVESLAAIYRLREHDSYKHYESCQALFVATNRSLVAHTRKYFHYDEERAGIPAIVDDTFLTGFVWLKTETTNEKLPTLKIISDALSSQVLSPDFWDSFLKKIDEYTDQNVINAEQALCLKADFYTRKNVYELTNGDIEKFDHGTVNELISRNERERHKILLNDNEKLYKTNMDQCAVINNLEAKIINARVNDYCKQPLSKWKILYYMSKAGLPTICFTIVLFTTVIDILLKSKISEVVNYSSIAVFALSLIEKVFEQKLSAHITTFSTIFINKSYQCFVKTVTEKEEEYRDEIIDKMKETKYFSKL